MPPIWEYGKIIEENGIKYECRLSDDLDIKPPWMPVDQVVPGQEKQPYDISLLRKDAIKNYIGAGQQKNAAECGYVLRVVVPMRTTMASVPAPSPSTEWNGKCFRCGKGTYSGLFSMEHEGGDCR